MEAIDHGTSIFPHIQPRKPNGVDHGTDAQNKEQGEGLEVPRPRNLEEQYEDERAERVGRAVAREMERTLERLQPATKENQVAYWLKTFGPWLFAVAGILSVSYVPKDSADMRTTVSLIQRSLDQVEKDRARQAVELRLAQEYNRDLYLYLGAWARERGIPPPPKPPTDIDGQK